MVQAASETQGILQAELSRAPTARLRQGAYDLRFARRPEELDEILKLRFRVFNLELGEGLDESFASGRDRDEFDEVCHHLLVVDRRSSEIVGTYRMQTSEMAAMERGFYSADEFEVEALPDSLLAGSIEVGRACIAREHRNRQVLFLLWKGLALYMSSFEKGYIFGCCSLTSQDVVAGMKLFRQLERDGHVHSELRSVPVAGYECVCDEELLTDRAEVEVPVLFAAYLRYGALVCSPPAVDRRFKTIDYLVVLDLETLDPATIRLFFDTP
jgi:putative hemolysin